MGYSDDYDRLSIAEKLEYGSKPLIIGPARKVAAKAHEEARRRFPQLSPHNTERDAFRHCYASALLVRDVGLVNAYTLTEAHEDGASQPVEEAEMDRYNNARGLEIGVHAGLKASDRDVSDGVMHALARKELRTLEPRNWPDVTKRK